MIEWAVTSSVLIAVIIALRYILKGKISLRLQYALWAFVLLRLLIPFSIGSSGLSIMNSIQNNLVFQDVEAIRGVDHIEYSSDGSVEGYLPSDYMRDFPTVVAENKTADDYSRMEKVLSFRQIFVPLWLGGVIVLLAVFAACNMRFANRLRRSRKPLDVKGSIIPVYVSCNAGTPCLFGFFRPAIYVTPEAMESQTALHHIIEHETTHYRHGDNIWSIQRVVCLALHWYNPLVWWAAVLSRNDAELSCDESTIRRIGESQRDEYGRTLIKMTCQKRDALLLSATTMTGGRKRIRERITMIAIKPRMTVYTLIAVLLLASVAVVCTFTGAKSSLNPWNWTNELSAESITSASSWQAEKSRELSDVEIRSLTYLLNALNEDDFIQNKDLVGGTPEYGLYIVSTNGEYNISQSIASSGSLEMDYAGKLWWIDSPELDEFVKNLVGLSSSPETVKLTHEQLEYANELLAPIITDADGNATVNPISCFFTSNYESPEDLDLNQFLRYFPYGSDEIADSEFESLKALDGWPFHSDIKSEDMPVPIHKYTAKSIDNVLYQYAGITLADLNGVGSEYVFYLEEYDSYYNFTSDFGAGIFNCSRGEIQGDTVRLYMDSGNEHPKTLTLRELDGRYIITSHQIS